MPYSYKRKWYQGDWVVPAFVVGWIVLVILFVVLAPKFASNHRAQGAVENLGWTNVHVQSKSLAFGSLSGCSSDDNVQFRVSGVSNGQRRIAHVCANWPIGGYTVRN